MAQRLRDANPKSFRNIVGRALEAHGRKLWHPSAEVLANLQALYAATDDMLEGIYGGI